MGHVKKIEGPNGELGLDVDFGPAAFSHVFGHAIEYFEFAEQEFQRWRWLEEAAQDPCGIFYSRQRRSIRKMYGAARNWRDAPQMEWCRDDVVASLGDFLSHKAVIFESSIGDGIFRSGPMPSDTHTFYWSAAALAGVQGTAFKVLLNKIPKVQDISMQMLKDAHFEGVLYRKLGSPAASIATAADPERLKQVEGEVDDLDKRVASIRSMVEAAVGEARRLRDQTMEETEDQAKRLLGRLDELRHLSLKLDKEVEESTQSLRGTLDRASDEAEVLLAALRLRYDEWERGAQERWEAIETEYRQRAKMEASTSLWASKQKGHAGRTHWAQGTFYLTGIMTIGALAWMVYGLKLMFPDPQTQLHSMLLLTIPAGILAWVMRLSHREVTTNRALQDDAAERIAMINTLAALSTEVGGIDDATRKKAMEAIFRPAAAPPDDNSPATMIEAFGKIAERVASKVGRR